MVKRSMCALALLAVWAGAASAQVRAGGQTAVNSYVTGRQTEPGIAVEPDGDFVAAWEDRAGRDGSYTGLFAQRYDRTGARRGGEFQVNTYTTGYQGDNGHLGIAADAHGRFVVAWAGADDVGQAWNVFARRFDQNGIGVGSDFQVNTSTTGSDGGTGSYTNVDVAMNPSGDFVVVWSSYGGTTSDIKGQRFDRQGQRLGGELVINDAPGRHDGAGVSMNAAGDFVVAWTTHPDAGGYESDVMARRFSAAGQPLGAQFQVNTYTTGTQGYSGLYSVRVALADSGRFTVMWNSFGQPPHAADVGVFGQAFAADGARVGDEFVVSTGTTSYQSFFSARASANGDVVATWEDIGLDGDGGGVFAQRFDDRGGRRGAEFQVNTITAGLQGVPDVAFDSAGNFDVVWASVGPAPASTDIFLQRFQGLAPARLDVDTGGNHVLEPGESANVAPTWRNVNGAAQTFSATLSDPTGPPGGVPTLTDARGDYGTVADGAFGPCTDCYAIAVPDPATRPAPHWDAAVTESISPDAQGQRKVWLLHVGRSFADVPTSSGFYAFVETLLHNGVTAGCTGTAYCPGTAVSRDQMAVFVLAANEGAGYAPPACTTPVFNDVPAGSPFCRFIEELVRRGVVAGCGGGRYCPADAVTREQMAVFVLHTLDPALSPPACTAPVFGDVPATSPFCRWVEELARRGVVTGCGGGNYCPSQPVTREQMAVFISATFRLTLYGI